MKNIFCLYQSHSNWARSSNRLIPLWWCSPFDVWLNLIPIATQDLRCIVVFSPHTFYFNWGHPEVSLLLAAFTLASAGAQLWLSWARIAATPLVSIVKIPPWKLKTLNNQFVEQKHLQFPMLLLLMQKVLWLPSALNSIIPIFYPHEMLLLF